MPLMRELKFYLILTCLLYGGCSTSALMAQKLAMSAPPSLQERIDQDQYQVSMIEALDELSKTYDVFFTYNTARLRSYQVSTEY